MVILILSPEFTASAPFTGSPSHSTYPKPPISLALGECPFILLASMPCVLGYNLWSGFHPLLGKDVLDSEDFLVSNLLLPGGSLVYLMFCVSKWGWGFDRYLAEANAGAGWKLPEKGAARTLLQGYFSVVLPLLILLILVQGLPTLGWKISVCTVVVCLLVWMSRRKK